MSNLKLASSALLMVLAAGVVRAEEPAPPAVEPIDYKKLKAWLPADLAGQKRTNAEGQKMGMGEVKMSQAEGKYGQSDGDAPKTLELSVIDYGATKGMIEGLSAFASMDIDQDGDKGFQKTVKLGEYRALLTYDTESKRGEATVFVAKRFIVKVTLNNLPPEDVQKTAESLKLDDLAKLAS